MRRGSTPTNTFVVPIDLSQATVFISYEQNGRVVVEKTNEDLTFSAGEDETYTIELTLTQEETLRFNPGDVFIQIRYVFPTGAADASNVIRTTFERIIKDGEIEP